MPGGIDRRRFITISAAATGLGLLPNGALSKQPAQLIEWRGTSLGALATIRIHHDDRAAAERLIRRIVAETRRLEGVFSLYQPDSSLCALNRSGLLVAPPAELVHLLGHCDEIWRVTGGTFDPTVQPLWQCYAEHFAAAGNASGGPPKDKLEQAVALVGWEKLSFSRDRIVFGQTGMGLTLNGIAQGYITDCVVELLQAGGFEDCLVDMGEIRARGLDGQRPWQVAIEAPPGTTASGSPVSLLNKAIATSGASGFQFDAQGRYNHLFDPSTGTCASPARAVTVITDAAATSDALSTAFALMDESEIEAVAARSAGTQVYVTTAAGTREVGERS
jgi:thiamine biosynthesis lipoprotein